MSNYYYQEQRAFAFGDRITWGVQRLILANTIVFAVQLILDVFVPGTIASMAGLAPPGGIVVNLLAFSPHHVLSGWVWTPFTYMFLHASLSHIFFNMLWLFFFGPEVERLLGTRQFLQFFIICGSIGVLAGMIPFMMGGASVPVVGASGAIMGVLIAFAMTNPDREFFLFPLPMPINARAMVAIVIVLNVLGALGITGGRESVSTHIGGMVVGYAYMKFIPYLNRLDFKPRKRKFKGKKVDIDRVGEAVDNIFEFDDKRRHHD